MIRDLTQGNTTKVIISFSLPLLFSSAIQQFYNIADSMIVGNLDSSNGLAAIGAAYPVTLFLIAITTGSAMGCTVVISQLFGAKKYNDVKSAIYTASIALVILGAVVAAAGFFLAGPLMHLLGVNEEVFDGAKTYLAIYSLGIFPLIIYNASNAAFTGLGDSRRPLYFLIASSVMNIILDIIAVGPLKMGVRGAAWATAISQLAAAMLSGAVLLGKLKNLETDGYIKRFSMPLFREIARVSIPSIFQQVTVSMGHILIQRIVNSYNAATMAGYEVGAKVMNFVYMCFNSLGTGLAGFVGQNYGARKTDRIHTGYKMLFLTGLALAAVVVAICEIFPENIVSLFVNSEDKNVAEVIQVGATYLRITTPDLFIISLIIPSGGLLRGLGEVRKFFIATVIDLGLRVISCYVLTSVIGNYTGLFWAWYIGGIVDVIMCLIWYFRMQRPGGKLCRENVV